MAKNNQILMVGGVQYTMDLQDDGSVKVEKRVIPPKVTG